MAREPRKKRLDFDNKLDHITLGLGTVTVNVPRHSRQDCVTAG